jgi:predicted glycosyltransferase
VNDRQTVLLYCQHSLGLGHLVRSFALAHALAQRFRVVLLSGGRLPETTAPPAGVDVISLPALNMGTNGVLVSSGRRVPVDRALRLRRDEMLRVQAAVQPDILLVELFPFGRRKFAGELLPLIAAAREAGSLVACSLRDILTSSRRDQSGHDEWSSMLANRWFDAILVHADPRFARLEESFRPRTSLRVPLHYTGFVSPPGPVRPPTRTRRVVVSAGGGRYGGALLMTAMQAHRRRLAARGVDLKVLAGPFLPNRTWHALREAALGHDDVEVLRSVPDLCAELTTAVASVSQCGYNTALDIVRAGVPALVVPFAEGREDEQTRRAERLAALGVLRMLDPRALSPSRLATELSALLDFTPVHPDLDLDGARASARILSALATRCRQPVLGAAG